MLYFENLNDLVLTREIHQNERIVEADEIIIVSGYISAYPISKLTTLGFDKITVIGGMYDQGMCRVKYDNLLKVNNKHNELNIYIAENQIHSKLYVWKKAGKIISGLIGSANLTNIGLSKNKRECLSLIDTDDYEKLNNYLDYINSVSVRMIDFNTSLLIEKIESNGDNEEGYVDFYQNSKLYNLAHRSINLPLYPKNKIIPDKSGLNWGFANAKNKINDAYIAIYSEDIRKNKVFFKSFVIDSGKNNKPMDIIWDDGTKMQIQFEGKQIVDGLTYPKQAASFSVKSILGEYLRERMNIESGHRVTYEMLENYGKTSIELSHIKGNLYFADFSVGN